MVNIDMILERKGTSLLQLVKVIKECTGLGLKDSKDIADSFSFKNSCKIDVTNRKEFQYLLDTDTDWVFRIEDKRTNRLNRLIELGLGDINDRVDKIAENLSQDIIANLGSSPVIRSHSANYRVYHEFFCDLISKLDPEQIEKLENIYSDKNKKSETN